MLTLRFLGAAGTVTGSKYALQIDGRTSLVDCGLFQGLKELRLRNWEPLPLAAASVDHVVLTHAHIDHSGYLPRLLAQGFRGDVFATRATAELLGVLLPDSGHLQEEEARYRNLTGATKHRPALPLYTREDAERCLAQLAPVAYHADFAPARGVNARFTRAGHIIGAGCLALRAEGRTITFTGDVGRPVDPVMKAPEPLGATDTLVIESTYGDRRHPAEDVAELLRRVIVETFEKRGTLVVPAFAVGRAQHLLHLIAELRAHRRIPEIPVFLDSPMSIDATGLFCDHKDDHRLSDAQCTLMCKLASYTRTPDDSKAIDSRSDPMIIVSASGMATGGRVLHHLARFLPEERNTVLLVGYQAAGTRGRSLAEGADELKMLGQYVSVRARVVKIDGLSAHADYAEMIDWLRTSAIAPSRVFVTHGEPGASDAFRRRLVDTFGWNARVPALDEKVALP